MSEVFDPEFTPPEFPSQQSLPYPARDENRGLSLWFQRLIGWVGILAGIASVVLTVIVMNQKTDIQDMDKVLDELVTQNKSLNLSVEKQNELLKKQDNQISSLTIIVDENQRLNKQLSSLVSSYALQNDLIKTNTAPNIVIKTPVQLDSSRFITEGRLFYRVPFKNIGNREAINAEISLAIVDKKNYKTTFIGQGTVKFAAVPSNTDSFIEIELKEMLKTYGFRLIISYSDRYSTKTKTEKYYYLHSYPIQKNMDNLVNLNAESVKEFENIIKSQNKQN